MPANFPGEINFVARETSCDWLGCAVIKKYLHQPNEGAFARLSLAKCKTALTSSGVTSKTSVISSTDIPASRLSKTVCTGILVPRKTQAPLTLPGTLSTAAHCDQSRLAISLPS